MPPKIFMVLFYYRDMESHKNNLLSHPEELNIYSITWKIIVKYVCYVYYFKYHTRKYFIAIFSECNILIKYSQIKCHILINLLINVTNDPGTTGMCSQESADLVTFTEEILNGKLHFLCSVWGISKYLFWKSQIDTKGLWVIFSFTIKQI